MQLFLILGSNSTFCKFRLEIIQFRSFATVLCGIFTGIGLKLIDV